MVGEIVENVAEQETEYQSPEPGLYLSVWSRNVLMGHKYVDIYVSQTTGPYHSVIYFFLIFFLFFFSPRPKPANLRPPPPLPSPPFPSLFPPLLPVLVEPKVGRSKPLLSI